MCVFSLRSGVRRRSLWRRDANSQRESKPEPHQAWPRLFLFTLNEAQTIWRHAHAEKQSPVPLPIIRVRGYSPWRGPVCPESSPGTQSARGQIMRLLHQRQLEKEIKLLTLVNNPELLKTAVSLNPLVPRSREARCYCPAWGPKYFALHFTFLDHIFQLREEKKETQSNYWLQHGVAG